VEESYIKEFYMLIRITDFIKSYRYYPIMEKYLEEKGMGFCNTWKMKKLPRLSYALWHSKYANLIGRWKE
jgi:hypothetical protein